MKKTYEELENCFNKLREEIKKRNDELKKRKIILISTADFYNNYKEIMEQIEYEKLIVWCYDSPMVSHLI